MKGFRWSERLVIRVAAWCMIWTPNPPAELRAAFDRSFRRRDETWRQRIWRAAAERAALRSRA